ncbi:MULTISPECIES: hypothetical protein [unclassified Pseudoalteromonas]|uniref:hypothetical protein n=1 Tax=unclassified Pseudoalteromonas TaxID=194690 RepID=UPI0018FE170D|nr:MULTISPECIES: hypothetical protein [unclassified Pseudoalteromonas]MBS3796794.1 hypothetical protein [Pseudoalteromonas sp. BDTF-M6]
MSQEQFIMVPPTTTVYCPQRGEGWTLTGITGIDEYTSVMFDGVRYTLSAREIVEQLLPNQQAREQAGS